MRGNETYGIISAACFKGTDWKPLDWPNDGTGPRKSHPFGSDL